MSFVYKNGRYLIKSTEALSELLPYKIDIVRNIEQFVIFKKPGHIFSFLGLKSQLYMDYDSSWISVSIPSRITNNVCVMHPQGMNEYLYWLEDMSSDIFSERGVKRIK